MKTNSFFSFFICFLLNWSVASAQVNDNSGVSIAKENNVKSQSCSKASSDYQNTYRYQDAFIPKNSFIDEVVIPLNIVVLADDNGDYGAYTLETFNDDVHKLDWLNRAFQDPSLPSDPAPGFSSSYWLTTTKIRFEINNVFFYDSTFFFDDTTGANNLVAHHFNTASEASKFITCFIVKHVGIAGAGGFASNYKDTPYTVSAGRRDINMTGPWISNYGYWGDHLPHEIGHILGLNHTYSEGGCCPEMNTGIDYLSDVFFNPTLFEQPCPSKRDSLHWESSTDFCTNNLMSGKTYNHFISPLQAARMHRQLRMSNVRHYACNYSSIPHEIKKDETWDFQYKSYNDIVVKTGATLTIKCRLEMIKDSKIVIEPGASLIVDGGVVTSARSAGESDFWQGVVISKPSKRRKKSKSQRAYPGNLELKNGGTIENIQLK